MLDKSSVPGLAYFEGFEIDLLLVFVHHLIVHKIVHLTVGLLEIVVVVVVCCCCAWLVWYCLVLVWL